MFTYDLTKISENQTFAFSAENPTGVRGGGTAKECDKPCPSHEIPAGEEYTLAEIDGSGTIEHIWIGGSITHQLILRMYWDGQENPSVEAPLSSFFGYTFHDNLTDQKGDYPFLNSVAMMTAPSIGCNIYLPMPFKKHAKITLQNNSKVNIGTFYMITGSYGKHEGEVAYFHASYRQAHPVEKGHTYTVIDGIKGKGHFVGVTMAAGLNGASTCWVEGEARMYLDGESTPSLHYTGTEDYFCGSYAFGNDKKMHHYQTYSGAYAGMYCVMGNHTEQYNSQRRFLLYRFHITDPIRFNTEFRMTLDDLGWTGPRYDDFNTVAYWYQTLPTAPFRPLPSDWDMWSV